MSGPLGSQGQNRSTLELDRIISRLNDDFALQLCKPDVTLSPRKYRERQRSDEEARIDDIYQKIQQLHYRGDNRPTRYLSTSLRALLQERLLRILRDINGLESKQLSKRMSEVTANHSQKRPKGQPPHRYEHHDAVDALPVRSSGSFADSGVSLASGSHRSIGEVIQPLAQEPSFDQTFGSSRASFPSEVFSSKNTQDVSFISQTTVDSGYHDKSNRYPYSQQTSAESFSHSFGLSQSRNDVQQNWNSLPSRPNKPTNQLEYLDDSRFKSPLLLLDRSSQDSVGSVSQTIDEKLANIWPKLPIPALTHAPLAVIWEITRAALHCKVSLDQFDLLYEPNDSWHDQSSLRDTISNHHLFHGKSLPPSSDPVAWHTALGDFQTKFKTVTLSADLVYNQDSTGPLYSLQLHPLKLELGHRLARRFGADRFLEITIPSPSGSGSADEEPDVLKKDPKSLEKIVDWLTKPEHYFLGRTWRPFFVRNVKGKKISGTNRNTAVDRVYFFACDANNFRPSAAGGISPLAEALETKARTKMKLSGLLKWAIGIDNERNSEQPVTKLFSRLALSLSRTWPTVILEKHQIINKPEDLTCGGMVMNDGIGRISPSLARKVSVALGLSDCPSCFQGRLGSAKGMWLIDVDSEEDSERDWVETYPSQRKWKCDFEDPHHRTLEIRNWPSELRSASLNQQFIPVLEARSPQPDAMRRAVSEHLQRALHADLGEQAAAMKEPMSLRLWIHQSGPSKNDRSLDGSAGFLAGLPNDNADRVAFLLDSGFDQRRMKYLRELVWEMSYIYMAADFSSTLEEGEVHLSFSTKFQAEGFSDTLLENMDILVARAPAHLPSDIQRVRVVSRPELRKLKDVIIFSTKGTIPLADKLSGGDYDGDMAWVCWDQNIVRNFDSAPLPQKLDFIKSGYLRKVTTQFKDILDQDACVEFVSRAFLFNLQPSFLGRCTKYKERLCYFQNSVQDRDAIHLSQLLGYLVDQSKQGIEFTEEDWKQYAKEKGSRRPDAKGRLHILDYLRFDVADTVIDEVLTSFNKTVKANNAIPYDEDLTKLCNIYEERSKTSAGCSQLLKYLRGKINVLHDEWRVIKSRNGTDDSKFATKADSMYQRWIDIQLPAELLASGEFPELVHDFNKNSAMSNWELLKASTAFKNHYNNGYKFVWYMAGKQLGFIKAMAHRAPGETSKVMVIPEMWGILRPDKKLITSLSLQREAARDSESAVALEEVFDFDDNGTVIDDA
ncbi:RNA dependent RNA polymerase domain-containing protein [Trichoderma breve]|uniref:RNA-dependent RNA polymerase n=1 Tax=Trichoderma breve TaxID=2034170 RepID=A0A9W9BCP9_9HYPO|nr:RNA dependent RNA polymerase domain-containing protein [Trichoderma breve]KAJ4860710.1 RNA dependent RNA polymerase domain-containing protein [Trichoderma breve]